MTIGKSLLSTCFAHNGGDKCKCISRPFLVQYDLGLDGRWRLLPPVTVVHQPIPRVMISCKSGPIIYS